MSRLQDLEREFKGLVRRRREGSIDADDYRRRVTEVVQEYTALLDELPLPEVPKAIEEAVMG